MKWVIVRNPWWMFWARGMVFFRWVWMKPYGDEARNHRLFRHELQHCYDQFAMGSKWKWYWHYLKLGFKNGFGDTEHAYEAHAEEHEAEELTPMELHWYQTGVIRM